MIVPPPLSQRFPRCINAAVVPLTLFSTLLACKSREFNAVKAMSGNASIRAVQPAQYLHNQRTLANDTYDVIVKANITKDARNSGVVAPLREYYWSPMGLNIPKIEAMQPGNAQRLTQKFPRLGGGRAWGKNADLDESKSAEKKSFLVICNSEKFDGPDGRKFGDIETSFDVKANKDSIDDADAEEVEKLRLLLMSKRTEKGYSDGECWDVRSNGALDDAFFVRLGNRRNWLGGTTQGVDGAEKFFSDKKSDFQKLLSHAGLGETEQLAQLVQNSVEALHDPILAIERRMRVEGMPAVSTNMNTEKAEQLVSNLIVEFDDFRLGPTIRSTLPKVAPVLAFEIFSAHGRNRSPERLRAKLSPEVQHPNVDGAAFLDEVLSLGWEAGPFNAIVLPKFDNTFLARATVGVSGKTTHFIGILLPTGRFYVGPRLKDVPPAKIAAALHQSAERAGASEAGRDIPLYGIVSFEVDLPTGFILSISPLGAGGEDAALAVALHAHALQFHSDALVRNALGR